MTGARVERVHRYLAGRRALLRHVRRRPGGHRRRRPGRRSTAGTAGSARSRASIRRPGSASSSPTGHASRASPRSRRARARGSAAGSSSSRAPSSTTCRPARPDPGARAARGPGAHRRADDVRARRLVAVRRHRARRRRPARAVGGGRRALGAVPGPAAGGLTGMLAYGVCIGNRERYEALAAPRLRDLGGVIVEADDQRSICAAYNAILDAVADEPDIEALVLLHEDVTIESAAFIAAIRAELADPDVAIVGADRRPAPVEPALVAGRGARPGARLDRPRRLRRRQPRRRRARRPLPRAGAVGDPPPALRRGVVRRIPRLRLRHLPAGPRGGQARARLRPPDRAPHARRLRRRPRLRPRQLARSRRSGGSCCSRSATTVRPRRPPAARAAAGARPCPRPPGWRWPRARAAAAASRCRPPPRRAPRSSPRWRRRGRRRARRLDRRRRRRAASPCSAATERSPAELAPSAGIEIVAGQADTAVVIGAFERAADADAVAAGAPAPRSRPAACCSPSAATSRPSRRPSIRSSGDGPTWPTCARC